MVIILSLAIISSTFKEQKIYNKGRTGIVTNQYHVTELLGLTDKWKQPPCTGPALAGNPYKTIIV